MAIGGAKGHFPHFRRGIFLVDLLVPLVLRNAPKPILVTLPLLGVIFGDVLSDKMQFHCGLSTGPATKCSFAAV